MTDHATNQQALASGLLARLKPAAFPLLLIAILAAFIAWRSPFWAPKPAVFIEATYEQAAARAASSDKFLIVDAMAKWCGPCKAMDARTWPDESVVAWLNRHAVAFQFDVDAQPALAQHFGIGAMPTVIALREGKEVERKVGKLSATEMLDWLNSLQPPP